LQTLLDSAPRWGKREQLSDQGAYYSSAYIPTDFMLAARYTLIGRSLLAGAVEMENLDRTHTLKDDAAIVQIAKTMGVHEVVFVD